MWIAGQWQDYELLDCGGGEKLERWDKQYLVRPDPQAIWETPRRLPEWKRANARYLRSQTGGGHWEKKAKDGVDGIDQDRFACASLAGKHVKAGGEIHLGFFDHGYIFNFQVCQHGPALPRPLLCFA